MKRLPRCWPPRHMFQNYEGLGHWTASDATELAVWCDFSKQVVFQRPARVPPSDSKKKVLYLFFVESLRKTGGRWKATNTEKSHHSATPSPKKASENGPLWFSEHAAAICITRASFFIARLTWQMKRLGLWP